MRRYLVAIVLGTCCLVGILALLALSREPSTKSTVERDSEEPGNSLRALVGELVSQQTLPTIPMLHSIVGVKFVKPPKISAYASRTSEGGPAFLSSLKASAYVVTAHDRAHPIAESSLDIHDLTCVSPTPMFAYLRPYQQRSSLDNIDILPGNSLVRIFSGNTPNPRLNWLLMPNLENDSCLVGFKLTFTEVQ